MPKDSHGNAQPAGVTAIDTKNSLFVSNVRKIAFLGLDNVARIGAGDALLILLKDSVQDVKEIQNKLEADAS